MEYADQAVYGTPCIWYTLHMVTLYMVYPVYGVPCIWYTLYMVYSIYGIPCALYAADQAREERGYLSDSREEFRQEAGTCYYLLLATYCLLL